MTRPIHIPLVAALAMAADASVAGIDCPPGADQVDVRILPSVEYDADRRIYSYRYTIQSLESSRQRIDAIAIKIPGDKVDAMQSPDGWWGRPVEGQSSAAWDAVRIANPDAPADGIVDPSIVAIDAGDSLSGFVIESPLPPGPKTMYVTGEVPQVTVSSEREMEQIWAQCETVRQTLLESSKEVSTVGPVALGTAPGPEDEPSGSPDGASRQPPRSPPGRPDAMGIITGTCIDCPSEEVEE